ncbi:MAG TPA: hypothetical protein VK190_04995 [Pseudoneobacillus sp.]|nr:hypothetical protein [Pseudoneobacillus sp.]
MANYKPVKIIFDLDDPYQLAQYNHIKERTNSSSYVRTLIQLDMAGQPMIQPKQSVQPKQATDPPHDYEVVKEQTDTKSVNTIAKVATVSKVINQPVVVKINSSPVAVLDEDDDISLDGLL